MEKMSDERYAIKAENVVKKFGDLTALKGVSFKVKKGDVVGYLGPNGAGKTTTIKLLTNLLSPTSGNLYIDEIDVNRNPQEALRRVGTLIEVPGMYGYLTPNELLTHFGKVYRMDDEKIERRIKKVLKTVRLQEWEHKKIEDFSTGMKRRLAIGLALLSDPQILLLDEPVMGLDPKGIKEIRELINSLSEKDITIFLSSHLLNEVSLTCDKVIFLFKGEIVVYDDVETIVGDAKHNRISVEFLDPLSEDEIDSLKTLKYIDKIRVDGNKVRIYNSGKKERMHKILTSLIDEGFEVVSFSYEKKDLEDLYISLAGESEGGVK